MDDPSTRLAHRLSEARLAVGLTQREAAGLAGLRDHSLLAKYERGQVRAIPINTLARLAAVYGLTAAALLALDDDAVDLIAAMDQAPPAVKEQVRVLLEQLR